MADPVEPPAPDAAPGAAPEPARALDVVVPHAPTADGRGMRVVRFRDESIALAEIRPVAEGAPIDGDVIRLSPRGRTGAFDVEVVVRRAEALADAARVGPAQVATESYRTNWDTVFGDGPGDDAN